MSLSEFANLYYDRGWVCPKCNSVMAPRQMYCVFCNVNRRGTLTSSEIFESIETLDNGRVLLKRDGDKDDDEHK